MTSRKDGSVYVIYLAEKEENQPPSKIWLSSIQPKEGAKLTMLGTEKTLHWESVGSGFIVDIPESVQNNPPCEFAWTVKIPALK